MYVLQVALSVCIVILYPPEAILHMPVQTDRHVELLCDLPLQSLIPPLGYNIILILACSFYAFKARSLPDNFNESRYIFACVSTTLFLSLAFLPSYFAAFFAYHKVILLTLVVILNSSVVVLCLYIPRVYAVYYVEEAKLKIVGSILPATEFTSTLPNNTDSKPQQTSQQEL